MSCIPRGHRSGDKTPGSASHLMRAVKGSISAIQTRE